MKLAAFLLLATTTLLLAADAIPTYSPEDVFKNQDTLKGKVVQMLNTQREAKEISPTETRLEWSYGQVYTTTDPAQALKIQSARTLYVTVIEPGKKGAKITAVGNTLVGEKPGWE